MLWRETGRQGWTERSNSCFLLKILVKVYYTMLTIVLYFLLPKFIQADSGMELNCSPRDDGIALAHFLLP